VPHAPTLPGNVLLEIFNFYVVSSYSIDIWHTLVHVCQRWRRYVVFASPRGLDMKLLCTEGRSVTKDAGYLASIAHRPKYPLFLHNVATKCTRPSRFVFGN